VGRRAAEGDLVAQHHNFQNHAVFTFKLFYGEEAMLPEELCLGTWRDTPSSDEALKTSVQNIEEARLQAGTNLLSYQEETRR
jgi:hypothetical protein